MFLISRESQLVDAFRPFEQAEVELPRLKVGSLPLFVRDCLYWTSESGHRSYLVFAGSPGAKPLGIVFRQDAGSSPSGVGMCEWCHSTRGSGQVALMTATVSERRRVGVYLCSDLGCIDRIEENDRLRARKILRRMENFARQSLF